MKLFDAMIGYNPGSNEIEVGIHPDRTNWSGKYQMTVGACYAHHREMTDMQRALIMFINFNSAVVRDKVDVQAAHRAFLAIDEYRKYISPDMEGADSGNFIEGVL
jgi:hypothetical protein